MGVSEAKRLFTNILVIYTQEQKIRFKVNKRFKYNTKGVLILKVRDKDKKLESKLVVSYMHGGMFCLKMQYNKGKSERIINLMMPLEKLSERMSVEVDKAKSPKKHEINKKLERMKRMQKKFN